MNQNNQKEIVTIKTFLIDQPFSGNDYKLQKTSCLSFNTTISNVTMMGNRVKGARNGERETGNGKRGASHGERENEKWEQKQRTGNENIDRAAVPTSFSGFSLLPFPTESRRVGERTWERGCSGSSKVLFPFFIFPFPVLVIFLKNPTLIIRKLANGSGQLFLRYSTCFHIFFGRI